MGDVNGERNLFPIYSEEQSQCERFELLPDGIYEFIVTEALFTTSKAGNPMLKLVLSVYDKNGDERRVYDYLLGMQKMAYKVRHFFRSIGLIDEYERGIFNQAIQEGQSDLLLRDRRGKAKIGFQTGKEKPDGTKYHNSNCVNDYVCESEMNPQEDNFINDDITF